MMLLRSDVYVYSVDGPGKGSGRYGLVGHGNVCHWSRWGIQLESVCAFIVSLEAGRRVTSRILGLRMNRGQRCAWSVGRCQVEELRLKPGQLLQGIQPNPTISEGRCMKGVREWARIEQFGTEESSGRWYRRAERSRRTRTRVRGRKGSRITRRGGDDGTTAEVTKVPCGNDYLEVESRTRLQMTP